MGKLLDLVPKIEEGLFVDSVELMLARRDEWSPRPELEGKGEEKVTQLLTEAKKRI